jgi:hypothetical protein
VSRAGLVGVIALAAALVAGAIAWRGRSHPPSEAAVPVAPGPLGPKGAPSAGGAGAARAPRPFALLPPLPAEQPVLVKAGAPLAHVNGVAVTARDLVPIGEGQREQSMSPEMFQGLRDRAIDRELTFQAARGQGLELTPTQLQELEQVRANAKERGATDPAQIDLEVADARAGLLQAAMLSKTGSPKLFATDADVEKYYHDNPAAFEDLPQDPTARAVAWKAIEVQIRQTLSSEAHSKYQEVLRQYLDDLRAKARVTP